MKTISILGSGWLGLPLAKHFVAAGHCVKASTTSEGRVAELAAHRVEPFVIDIERRSRNLVAFLQVDVLIINIPCKNVDAFSKLVMEVERSTVQEVLFVSSTSVYRDGSQIVSEESGQEIADNILFKIENLFRSSSKFRTTIVRFGGLIGYNRHPGRFFRPGRRIENPHAPVNLIHRDDCVGIIGEIIAQNAWGEVFNACADSHPSKLAFYSRATESLGNPAPDFSDSGAGTFKIISNEKVKKVLAYEFLYPDLMEIEFGD